LLFVATAPTGPCEVIPMPSQATLFNELIQFKAPDGFAAAVNAAARKDHTSMAEFLRRTVILRLKEIGLPLNTVEPGDRRQLLE
jgi:hypothetical protein